MHLKTLRSEPSFLDYSPSFVLPISTMISFHIYILKFNIQNKFIYPNNVLDILNKFNAYLIFVCHYSYTSTIRGLNILHEILVLVSNIRCVDCFQQSKAGCHIRWALPAFYEIIIINYYTLYMTKVCPNFQVIPFQGLYVAKICFPYLHSAINSAFVHSERICLSLRLGKSWSSLQETTLKLKIHHTYKE